MGLSIDTLRATFPRTARALKNYQARIDDCNIDIPARERQILKAQAVALVLVTADEALEVTKKARLILNLFTRKG